jgi:hypothetical protein
MNELVSTEQRIPAMAPQAIERVRALESAIAARPQFMVETDHVLHGGIYSRTVLVPAGAVIAGALIKIATTLIVSGDCTVFVGDDAVRLTGYRVLAASAGRKQAFVAHADTYLTMVFQTNAATVEQAEAEFTDEADKLISRTDFGVNTFTITGEPKCRE